MTGVHLQDDLERPQSFEPSGTFCLHCADRIPAARLSDPSEDIACFCCSGCSAVYRYLHELNLDREYYALRSGSKSRFKPRISSDEDYSALDLPPFRSRENERGVLDFFLEGIHCTACVWLLERLPSLSSDVESARLDLSRSNLRVHVRADGKFENVAKLLLALGYRPHPVLSQEESENRIQTEDRKILKRIGVAAFSAMNVMIYSISLYTGVDGKHGVLFRVLSLLVAFPALTYSAWPFYRSAVTSLRSRRISIDLPISMAFVFGFLESLRQAGMGTNLLYLDSLTSLVLLMLLSRYALSRFERAELSKSGLLQALLPSRFEKLKARSMDEWENVRTDQIRVGDIVRLRPNARIPADGKVIRGDGYVDLSVLSGESNPIRVSLGEPVYAGSVFAAGEIQMVVQARGVDTRIGEIQERLENLDAENESSSFKRNQRTERSDRWAQIFLLVVIGLALVLLFAFGFENAGEAFRRSLSLLIIACPCALALATPLTLARAHRLASSQGILLRNPDILDRILKVKNVIFDKTGTLTRGQAEVREWLWKIDASASEKSFFESIAYTLESQARHPYGRAIVRYLEDRAGVRVVSNVEGVEIIGVGVEGAWNGELYGIGRMTASGKLTPLRKNELGLVFWREKEGEREILARLHVHDTARREAHEVVAALKKKDIRVQVLSGDSWENTESICRELGIESFQHSLTPLDKEKILDETDGSSLVVGDGINDALMLKSASIGVAFSRGDGSSIESALSSSDVAIMSSDLRGVLGLFDVARRYERTLTRNAVFSAFYNLIGASFAVMGYIHPLVAAIAMPISALTVFLSTLEGLKYRKNKGARL